MNAAWARLESAGVPTRLGSTARPDLDDLGAVAVATREVLTYRERLDERQRVSLLAWLRAWASSFPTSFREAFGDDRDVVLARAAEGVDDVGRYLKLRRLVKAKLSRSL